MAVRTTAEAVQAILINFDEDIDMGPFIEMASSVVDDVCAPLWVGNDAKLELIERCLAAHFYCRPDPRTTSEKADVVGESFENYVSLGFNNTRYGQDALRLDTKGGLAKLDRDSDSSRGKPSSRRVTAFWVGEDCNVPPPGFCE